MVMPITTAESTTEAPTERSIPPAAMTVVIPIAIIATKAKLRVTLKRLRLVAKVSVASVRPTQSTTAATNTQNTCRLVIRPKTERCWLSPIACSSEVVIRSSPVWL